MNERADHDGYGKKVLREAGGPELYTDGPKVVANLGDGNANIDGVINDIAIEVEARNEKQVRAAIVDLLMHPCPKKLLVLMKPNLKNKKTRQCVNQCRFVFNRLAPDLRTYRVIGLSGDGKDHRFEEDVALVRETLADMA